VLAVSTPWIVSSSPDEPVTGRQLENQLRALEFEIGDAMAADRRRTTIMLAVSSAIGLVLTGAAVLLARR